MMTSQQQNTMQILGKSNFKNMLEFMLKMITIEFLEYLQLSLYPHVLSELLLGLQMLMMMYLTC